MSEKRPRGKKAEYPEFDPKPALEKLIDTASKPSGKAAVELSGGAHQEKQREAPVESLSEKELEKLLLDAAIRNIESPDSFKEVLRTVFERKGEVSPVDLKRIRAVAKQNLIGPGSYGEVEKYINEEGYRSEDPVSKEQPETPAEPLSEEGQLENHILSRKNDAFLQEQLGKFDTLSFKPGFLPEELAKETNDAQLRIFLKKIDEERKPLGVTFLNYINELKEAGASPEAIQTMMSVAEKKLDADMFKKLQGFVYKGQAHDGNKEKDEGIVEKNEVGFSKGDIVAVSPESGVVAPEDLPRGTPDELANFEKNLTRSVGEWQEEKKRKNRSKSIGNNIPALPHIVDAEWSPVSKRGMIEDTRGTQPSLTEGNPVVSDKKTTPEPEEYPLRSGVSESSTYQEWKDELRRLIFGEKNSEGSNEQSEGLKAYIAKRSEELGERAKEYGPKFAGYIGSKIEQYNKLKWWQKLAVTGALMTGAAFSGGGLATGFAAALWGQRAVGAIGAGMNRRKKIDAEIAKNPEHKLAGKSEWEKNKSAALYAAKYMAITSGAIYLGVEGLKAAAESEWLANMLGHNPAEPDIDASGSGALEETEEALELLPDVLETDPLIPEVDMPEAHPEPYNEIDPRIADIAEARETIDDGIAKAHEALNRMDKLVDEQAKILDALSNGSETSPPDLSSSNENITPSEQEVRVGEVSDAPNQPTIEGKIGPDRMFDAQERIERGLPPDESGQFRGLEHRDGMKDVEAATHDPRGTDAFPKPPEEKGFFEKIFGSSDENPTEVADQFNIDSVSAAEPHIYADAEGHLFAHGGSIEARIEEIQKFLTENPDKIVYGTDDNGQYRIPWYLYEGRALPSEPVRTNGFLGLGSVLMDAAKPEEFVKKIK